MHLKNSEAAHSRVTHSLKPVIAEALAVGIPENEINTMVTKLISSIKEVRQ